VILEEGWPILTMGGVGACQADVLLDRRPLASRHLRRTSGAVRTHLPSTAHLPSRQDTGTVWRAVPGGAGSGRCAARAGKSHRRLLIEAISRQLSAFSHLLWLMADLLLRACRGL
jgi:hypothetical protein